MDYLVYDATTFYDINNTTNQQNKRVNCRAFPVNGSAKRDDC